MNKPILYLMIFCLLLLLVPVPANAVTPVATDSISVAEKAKVNDLLARLDEIRLINRSSILPSERKEVRKEVRSIKEQLRTLNGGVYISVGALLIVIILLILLL